MDRQLDEIMERYALDGDDEAFAPLYRQLRPLVRRYLRRWQVPAGSLCDATQDVFLRMHLGRQSFQRGQRVVPWLLQVTHNVARDRGRRARSRPHHQADALDEHQLPVSAPDAEEQLLALERRRAIRSAIARLPASQRGVVELVSIEGLTPAEAGARTGATGLAVKLRVFRARKTLEREIPTSI
jgi:RNA polymerase sigma-70 factor (ECF subfamily)